MTGTPAPAGTRQQTDPFEPDPFELRALLASLSARDSTPAAGSAAAIAGALAAAVVVKAARRADDGGTAAQAGALAERLAALAALDAEVFSTALAALRYVTERREAGGRGSESSDFQLGRILEQAAIVPLTIVEAAVDVAILAAELARAGPSELREDAVSAVHLAAGAARGAAHLVGINLAVGADAEATARAAAALAYLPDPLRLGTLD